MKKHKTLLTVAATFLATSLVWLTVYYCMFMSNPVIKKAADAYQIIEKNFILDYDEDFVKNYTVAAMVSALDDPYSAFYPEGYYEKLAENASGHYYGIGITVVPDSENDYIVINEVKEGTPAYNAGLQPEDIILEANGIKVGYSNYEEAVDIIRGSEGDTEELHLKILRNSTGNEFSVSVTREKIINSPVTGEMFKDGIAYVRIKKFDNETHNEFRTVLEQLGVEKINYLIIDLRDNGGGTLYSTKNIADMLMPKGVLTSFVYKNGTKQDIMVSDDQLVTAPIGILVNGNSASASEVLSSGLRDNGRAVLIGEKTFGKAIAQNTIPFETENGKIKSAIYLTCAKYLTPAGENIHGKGLEPDIVVETPEKYKEIPVDEWVREEDIQLITALETAEKTLKEK